MVCEISQPKKGPSENGPWLGNNFAAPKHRCENRPPCCENRLLLRNGFIASQPPLEKFSQLRSDPLTHVCHFAAAKWLRNLHALKSFISQPRLHFVGCFAAAKPPLGTRVPFCSSIPSFRNCENVATMPSSTKMTTCCEIRPPSPRCKNSQLLQK